LDFLSSIALPGNDPLNRSVAKVVLLVLVYSMRVPAGHFGRIRPRT